MKTSSWRRGGGQVGILLSCLIVGLFFLLHPSAHAQQQPAGASDTGSANALASAKQIEAQAFKDICAADFKAGSDLLARAGVVSTDPMVQTMSDWVKGFEVQRQQFALARNKQFDQDIADAQTLLDHHMDGYALDEIAMAYPLADDSAAFRQQDWVDALARSSAASAAKCEDVGQWLQAVRYYSDLGQIDPASVQWKEALKLVTRRIRLLYIYAPDRLKTLQDADNSLRQAADGLIHPSTRPATQPEATTEGQDIRVSWHDVTAGIKYDMLHDALDMAEQQYYRQVTFQDLLAGGLIGLRAVATTDGLQDAFPGLANKDNRDRFVAELDDWAAKGKAATADNARAVMFDALNTLMSRNHQTINLPDEVFVSEFADGAFSKLDPFSTIIWPYDVPDFEKQTQGQFVGVGIQIELNDDGNIKVVTPLEDTPAYRAGIKAGDVIVKIDGKNAKGITLDRAVNTITGKPGTSVTLTVRSLDATTHDVTIRRQLIKVDSVRGYLHKDGGGWNFIIDPDQKIAYIRLSSFSKDSADDMDKALDEIKAQGARGIVLDLRSNPGGLLQVATQIVNMFVSKGVIVSTHADRQTVNAPTEAIADPADQKTKLPMVVLVNQMSASASEVVSGALKDDQRALIVGERTFGKGSVQMLFDLGNRQAYLKLTTSHYYLPNGVCIHREENSTTWGVDPDVPVVMTPQQMQDAINARQDMDVLRDANAPVTNPSTKPARQQLLDADLQLSAGLTVLRLELAGASI